MSFSKQETKIQKGYFNGQFLTFGFVRSNLVKKISKKQKIISFVSEYYRTKSKKEKNYEAKLLKTLAKVCKLQNLSLFIILRSNRKDKILDATEEINYFLTFLVINLNMAIAILTMLVTVHLSMFLKIPI